MHANPKSGMWLAVAAVAIGLACTGLSPAIAGQEQGRDDILTEVQTLYAQWTERTFRKTLDRSLFAELSESEKAELEANWISMLDELEGRSRCEAINGLAAIRSKKAVPALLEIAADRREQDNRARWMAVRALDMIGDRSVTPELIHLVYHYNSNTRFWAQISLARLNGVNFETNWETWGAWWNEQNLTPRFSPEKIEWTTNPEWADPDWQYRMDVETIEKLKGAARNTPAGQPHVVRTTPADGARDVDVDTTEIVVEFDRDMDQRGYSWCGGGPTYPKATGRPTWRSPRVCVLPVKLEPHHVYTLSINCSARNFRSADGVPVEPYPIEFHTTGPAGAKTTAADLIPKIVKITPADGAEDVDPATAEIVVEFDRDMSQGGFSWCGGGPTYPKIIGRPVWRNARTCVLTVGLKPKHTYSLSINCPSARNFRSAGGVPVEPYGLMFKTGRSR